MKAPAPTNLKVTTSGTKAKLEWDKVEQADGYIIYRSDGENPFKTLKTINTNDTTTYTTKVEEDVEYHYRVFAYRLIDGEIVKGNKIEN